MTLIRDPGFKDLVEVDIDFMFVSQIAFKALRFDMVCRRFCPQALAQALQVNNTVADIKLRANGIGKEGAQAWCLAGGLWFQASKQ